MVRPNIGSSYPASELAVSLAQGYPGAQRRDPRVIPASLQSNANGSVPPSSIPRRRRIGRRTRRPGFCADSDRCRAEHKSGSRIAVDIEQKEFGGEPPRSAVPSTRAHGCRRPRRRRRQELPSGGREEDVERFVDAILQRIEGDDAGLADGGGRPVPVARRPSPWPDRSADTLKPRHARAPRRARRALARTSSSASR